MSAKVYWEVKINILKFDNLDFIPITRQILVPFPAPRKKKWLRALLGFSGVLHVTRHAYISYIEGSEPAENAK